MKTNYFGSHFETPVSSVQTATPPASGDASRIPGESTLGCSKIYIFNLCDIFNCTISVEAIIKPKLTASVLSLDPIHGHTGTS